MMGISARTVSKSELAMLLRKLALETRRRLEEPGPRDEESMTWLRPRSGRGQPVMHSKVSPAGAASPPGPSSKKATIPELEGGSGTDGRCAAGALCSPE